MMQSIPGVNVLPAPKRRLPLARLFRRRETIIFTLLILESAVFGILTPGFLQPGNLSTIIQNSVDLAVVAVGMSLAMVMGGIDISVGSLLGVVAIAAGRMVQAGFGIALIVPVAILIGALVGSLNGLIIAYLRVPAIIATLGTSNIFRALVFGLLGGTWITGLPPTLDIFNGRLGGWLPVPAITIVVVYLVFWYFTSYVRLGRFIYAVGSSREASRLAGIDTRHVTLAVHMIIGSLTGIAALSYIARMGSVEVTVGQSLALQAIAATVVGGTSVTGGQGSVLGTLVGVLFINVLQNGILLLGVPSLMEWAIIGVFMILSVSIDLVWNRPALRQ
jgi:ribose transport system permease protein/AI-2 transport system permease protein